MSGDNIDQLMDEIKHKNTGFMHSVQAMRECLQKVDKEYEERVKCIKEFLKNLQERISGIEDESDERLVKELIDFLRQEEYGLEVLLAVSGLSKERLLRIISMIRIAFKSGIYQRYKEQYAEDWLDRDDWRRRRDREVFSEWKESKIKQMIRDDESFAKSIVLILLGRNEFVNRVLGRFERPLRVSLSKLKMDNEDIWDTLIRSSLYGSYSARRGQCPEDLIKEIVREKLRLTYEGGKVENIDRKIDVIIPSKKNPKIFIQIAYVETTSSGMGDKAKAEKDTVRKAIKENYPDATFILFVDGLGWLSREEALRMMCEAGDRVFTFHPEHIEKFVELLSELKQKYNLQSQTSLTEY